MESISEKVLLSEFDAQPVITTASTLISKVKDAIGGLGVKEWAGVAGAAALFCLATRKTSICLQGANVVMLSPVEDGLMELKNEIKARRRGGQVFGATFSFSDDDRMAAFEEEIRGVCGVPDIVISVGPHAETRTVEELSYAELNSYVKGSITNYAAVFRAFLPHMIQRRSGILVVVQEGCRHVSHIGTAAHAACQWGVNGLVAALSADTFGSGVFVQEVLLPQADRPTGAGQTSSQNSALSQCSQDWRTSQYAEWVINAIQIRAKLSDCSRRRPRQPASSQDAAEVSFERKAEPAGTEVQEWLGQGDKTTRLAANRPSPSINLVKTAASNTSATEAPQLAGVGIKLSREHNGLQIVGLLPGSAAAECGSIQPGYVLVSVDKKPVASLSPDEALTLLQGPLGTFVTITVKKSGPSSKENTVRLMRGSATDSAWRSKKPEFIPSSTAFTTPPATPERQTPVSTPERQHAFNVNVKTVPQSVPTLPLASLPGETPSRPARPQDSPPSTVATEADDNKSYDTSAALGMDMFATMKGGVASKVVKSQKGDASTLSAKTVVSQSGEDSNAAKSSVEDAKSTKPSKKKSPAKKKEDSSWINKHATKEQDGAGGESQAQTVSLSSPATTTSTTATTTSPTTTTSPPTKTSSPPVKSIVC